MVLYMLYLRKHLTVHSEEKSNNVMSDPSPPSTSYGALYLASQVYGGPLGLWVKVIQFTWENKHRCQNKTLAIFSSRNRPLQRPWGWEKSCSPTPHLLEKSGGLLLLLLLFQKKEVDEAVNKTQQRWWRWWRKRCDSHQPSFTIGRHWLSGFAASHLTSTGWGCCTTLLLYVLLL